MSDIELTYCSFLIGLDADERADLPRATYFVLEAYYEAGDQYHLSSIEEAEEEGGYALHIGLPDRPAHRYATHFGSFEAALKCLQRLNKESHPDAAMWLSTVEILAEIKGSDIWRGAVHARASCDPTDDECPWNTLSAALTKADAQGRGVVLIADEMPPVIEDIATHF